MSLHETLQNLYISTKQIEVADFQTIENMTLEHFMGNLGDDTQRVWLFPRAPFTNTAWL